MEYCRYEIDKRYDFGQFILTGSAVPEQLDKSSHTATGRIARMKMRPMSLYESDDSNGQVSLKGLFDERDISGMDNYTIEDIAFEICRGEWPRAIGEEEKIALRQAL